jgi:hypothetical protein
VSARSTLDLRATRESYEVVVELEVREDDRTLARRRWERSIPRHLQ